MSVRSLHRTAPVIALPRVRPVRDGVRDALTVVIAYIPFGLALGATLVSLDVDPLVAWSSSPLLVAGAAQLVAVQLMSDGAGPVIVVLTALVVNSRHLLYSASLAPYWREWKRGTRAAGAYFLADPMYALAIARYEGHPAEDGTVRLRYYFAMALTAWAGWMTLTGAGVLLGGVLPASLPLELAAPLTFLLLLLPTLKRRPAYVAAATAGIVAIIAAPLPLGLGLIVAAAVGMFAGAFTERMQS
ncbi:AzlC family ABC transporter permease [Agromyces sp. SYSU T00194]|uniref:AzlC family ABC transporter permease n=1 Tax=Agromyces chitinivorans TaxID=3158560 RepID=UPI0033954F7F